MHVCVPYCDVRASACYNKFTCIHASPKDTAVNTVYTTDLTSINDKSTCHYLQITELKAKLDTNPPPIALHSPVIHL